jgi:hypothetical protein
MVPPSGARGKPVGGSGKPPLPVGNLDGLLAPCNDFWLDLCWATRIRVGARRTAMGLARRSAWEDKAQGGSGNTGKPSGNIGLPLTLADKPVRRRMGGNGAI